MNIYHSRFLISSIKFGSVYSKKKPQNSFSNAFDFFFGYIILYQLINCLPIEFADNFFISVSKKHLKSKRCIGRVKNQSKEIIFSFFHICY